MAAPGDVLAIPSLGVSFEFRATTERTRGELVEFDVVGRPRGFLTLPQRPAGDWEAWLERIAAIDRDGDYLPGGWPKPVAAAKLLLDFEGEAHGTLLPLSLQVRAARAVLSVAQSRR